MAASLYPSRNGNAVRDTYIPLKTVRRLTIQTKLKILPEGKSFSLEYHQTMADDAV